MDYVPHDELVKGLDSASRNGAGQSKKDHLDLYVSYHRVATRAYIVNDPFPAGAQRRAFVRRFPKYSGAISGVVELRGKLEGGKLRLAVRFQGAAHYNGGLLPDAAVSKMFRNIARGEDSKLIDKLSLRRGGQIVEMSRLGQQDGEFRFEVDFDEADLSDVSADLTMRVGQETFPIQFDLFASDLARQLRSGLDR